MRRGIVTLIVVVLALGVLAIPAQVRAQSEYLDNRSSPEWVMLSFVNVLNNRDYVRAYSYWKPDSKQLAAYPDFVKGYANTQSVQIALGSVIEDVGAGQLNYAVPTLLIATTTNGALQTFAGCYYLHLAQPGFQATLPFQPMGIRSALMKQVANGANANTLLATACPDMPAPRIGTPTLQPDLNAIDASLYIDDHSTGAGVLRSLFNAINRRDYVRAYSYWETEGGLPAGLPTFDNFVTGYANTQSVQIVIGVNRPGVAAGNLYDTLPVTLIATTTSGALQTFVGCYQTHMGNSLNYSAPPFYPLRIQKAKVQAVANNANTTALMTTICDF